MDAERPRCELCWPFAYIFSVSFSTPPCEIHFPDPLTREFLQAVSGSFYSGDTTPFVLPALKVKVSQCY